jgi:hypothetical protein
MIRTYSELSTIESFKDRFRYLALNGRVGDPTFGVDRYINQRFYTSTQWRQMRYYVIDRDQGCDLGVEGYDIHTKLVIHHMNPMTVDDIRHGDESILDPEFLITTTHQTHNAIHYGDERQLPRPFVPRRPGDTKLW